jgi:hypothetical protein
MKKSRHFVAVRIQTRVLTPEAGYISLRLCRIIQSRLPRKISTEFKTRISPYFIL